MIKSVVPAPLRALRWRFGALHARGLGPSAATARTLKILAWTARELCSQSISFRTPDGTYFDSLVGNFSALKVYLDNYRDPSIHAFLARYLQPGSTFIDVGANIGTYAVRAGQLVGQCGRVIALEASPTIFPFLVKNIKANGQSNVVPINVGVGAEEGSLHMNFIKRNPGETHVSTDKTGVVVQQRRLDDILTGLEVTGIAYIKIDVEGFEPAVLKGAAKTISESPNVVVQMEVIKQNLQRYGWSITDLTQVTTHFGLMPHRIADDGTPFRIGLADVQLGGDILWSRNELAAE